MKKAIAILGAVLIFGYLSDGAQSYRKGEILIQLKKGQELKAQSGTSFDDPGLDALGEKWGLKEWRSLIPKYDSRYPSISQMCILSLSDEADIEEVCRDYIENVSVEAVSPNYYILTAGTAGIPNDVHWNLQWNLFPDRTNAPGAWSLAYQPSFPPHGQPNGNRIILAILDSGVDTSHVDLRNSLWFNEGEVPDDGIDNDNNGYVDDVRGWNFGDGNKLVFNSNDNLAYHGTGCAGIAGAITNNNTGIAGFAGGWGSYHSGVTIMPIRMWSMQSGGTGLSKSISSLYYASANGAKILSCSWMVAAAGDDYTLLQNAINDVYNNNKLIIAASGNFFRDEKPFLMNPPAICNNVIAVGATIHADTAWYHAQYGPKLDLMAPGGNDDNGVGTIHTTYWPDYLGLPPSNDYYFHMGGTSAACPHVAGLAALMLQSNPSLTNVQVERILKWTADTVGSGALVWVPADYRKDVNPQTQNFQINMYYGEDHWNERYGYGRINAYKAVQAALSTPPVPCRTGNLRISTYRNAAGQCSLRVMCDYLPGTNGYRLYYGNASGAYTASKSHHVETSNFVYLTNPPNPLYASFKAFNYLGYEGGFSPEISFNLPQAEWWYIEKYGDHQNARVDLFYTSGNGAELVLDVKSPYGSQWVQGPVLRRNIPDIAVTPDIDLNVRWRQLDRDHALCLWFLVRGQDNVDRWLIYAANAWNQWGGSGTSDGIAFKYVHMGDPAELYGQEEEIQRNVSLDYYLSYGVKASLVKELRLSHFSYTGWSAGDHGGYIKDLAFTNQDWFAVLVQNQMLDRNNATNAGSIYCINNWYSSPFEAGCRTYVGDHLFIEARDYVEYPAGTANYFIYWSDGGSQRHSLGVPVKPAYTAYYKKNPVLSGYTAGGVSYLAWEWGNIPSGFPSYFYRLYVRSWMPTKDVPGNGYWYWRQIYTGSGTSYNHLLSTNDSRNFQVRVTCNSRTLSSNILSANDPVPGDPIVATVQGPEATAYSNGKKIVIDNTGRLHVTYTSGLHAEGGSGPQAGDTIYYTTSTDEGETWTPGEAVAMGQNPALALKADGTPLLCWNTGSNVYTAEKSGSSWGQAQLVYSGAPGEEISYLSFVADPNTGKTYSGWVSSSGGRSELLIAQRVPGSNIQPAPERLDFGDVVFKSPSLALKPDGGLITAWSKDGVVRFRQGNGGIIELSRPGRNAIHPIIETYGDRVSVVWQEAEDTKLQSYEVAKFRNGEETKALEPGRYRIVSKTKNEYGWGEEKVIAFSEDGDYQYPVAAAAGQYAYAGHHGDGNYDIHYLGDYAGGWETHVRNISIASEGQSGYPNVAFSNRWPEHALYILWTETFPESAKAIVRPPYVKVYKQTIQPVPIFEVYPRTDQASTYCTQRAGGLCYGAGAYMTVDYHPTELKYRFAGLNRDKRYKLKAVFYRATGGGSHPSNNWILQPRCDQVSFGTAHLPDTTVVTLEREIPKQCLNDGAVEITIRKIKGDYAVCSALELIEYTTGKGGKSGGVQSPEADALPAFYRYELMPCAPNPFHQMTTIRYQLARPGKVSLKVYNTVGQLVRTLEDGERPAGHHSVQWDGRDGNGHQVSNGVYLYRLETDGFGQTKKMALVR